MKIFPIDIKPIRKLSLRISHKFRWLSNIILKFNPGIERWIKQGEMDIDPEDYVFVSLVTSLFISLLPTISFLAIIYLTGQTIAENLLYLLLIFFLPFIFSWFLFVTYPRRIVYERGKEVDKKLAYGLREMIIQVKSGVPIYTAIKNIAKGDFGGLSEEFMRIVRDVESGVPLPEALENSALRVESKFYRNMIWAIVGSLRAGTDVSESLIEILRGLVNEQKIAIKNYAQSLNPMILMYMMVSIIFPILAIVLLIIVGSMGGITVGSYIFILIWFFIFSFQLFFIMTIRLKRPPVIG